MRSRLPDSRQGLLPLVAAILALTACHGGCPWTQVTEVEIVPPTPCLEVHVADASGEGASSGCVNPVLVIRNHCAGSFDLPGGFNYPGVSGRKGDDGLWLFQIPLDRAVERSKNRFSFSVPAMLAEEDLRLEFETYLAKGGRS